MKTDIANGCCTWLIVAALKRANPGEKKIVLENHGITDEAAVNRVQNISDYMNLQELHEETTDALVNSIRNDIERVSHQVIENYLLVLLHHFIEKYK